MEPSNHAPRAPHLIADAATLAAYVKDVAAGGHSWQAPDGQLSLEGWLALGDDCTEGAYRLAARLGLPLVRLRELPPGPDATALLRPEVVRRLRAVPRPCRLQRRSVLRWKLHVAPASRRRCRIVPTDMAAVCATPMPLPP